MDTTEQTLADVHRRQLEAEATLRSLNSRPLRLTCHDDFIELRCAMDNVAALIQRTAELFGVSDPGAATTAALVLEMQAAVDDYSDAHGDET
jgi:hypothetical protein